MAAREAARSTKVAERRDAQLHLESPNLREGRNTRVIGASSDHSQSVASGSRDRTICPVYRDGATDKRQLPYSRLCTPGQGRDGVTRAQDLLWLRQQAGAEPRGSPPRGEP